MKLVDEVRQWDGKSAEYIAGIFQQYSCQSGFIDQILDHITERDTERGMTWLLKAWFESGGELGTRQINRIYQNLDQLEHWQTKMHVLQCMSFMPVSESCKTKVERFLRNTLTDSNNFVRAWTYNGFHLLATQYPEYRKEVQKFIEMALRDESASVKARIKNIARGK